MVCNKCSEACVNPKESVKCVDCSNEFHLACLRIRSEKLRKMTPQDIASWRCNSCKQDVASLSSLPDKEDSDSSLVELLKSIKLEMSKNNSENRENFTSLKTEIAKVNSFLTSLEAKMSTLETENKALIVQCEALTKKNEDLSKHVQNLQNDMCEMQQYSRSNNIEIKGIPVTSNENIYSVLSSVATALDVDYSGGDISIAHRLQQPKDKSQPPSIVVQFVSRFVRNEWLAAAKKKHLQTTDLIKTFRPAPVFVNEHLTAENKALLGKSKYLVRKSKLHSAWTRNGIINVRKSSDSKTRRVRSLNEVCDIAGVPLTWTEEDVASNTQEEQLTTS